MNATEQIALLRRACEMAAEYSDRHSDRDYRRSWSVPDNESIIDCLGRTANEALSATATPPDDAPQAKTALPVYADTVESLRKERDDARLDRSAVLAQRDDALAKLAAKEKELADIYAAKPEPAFRADGNSVKRRGWEHFALCESMVDAMAVVDALNAGGGK